MRVIDVLIHLASASRQNYAPREREAPKCSPSRRNALAILTGTHIGGAHFPAGQSESRWRTWRSRRDARNRNDVVAPAAGRDVAQAAGSKCAARSTGMNPCTDLAGWSIGEEVVLYSSEPCPVLWRGTIASEGRHLIPSPMDKDPNLAAWYHPDLGLCSYWPVGTIRPAFASRCHS